MKRIQLKGGSLISLEPLRIEQADLLIEGDRIVASGPQVPTDKDTFVLDCRGRYILPGLANSRLRLSGDSARLLPDALGQEGCDRLEEALTLETAIALAFSTAMDAIRQGTTAAEVRMTVSNDAGEMLRLVRDTFLTVGLRGTLYGEVSASTDTESFGVMIDEVVREAEQGRSSTMKIGISLRDVERMDDSTLDTIQQKMGESTLPLQIGLSLNDESVPATLERLNARGFLNPSTTLNPAGALSEAIQKNLSEKGVWITYCPTSAARRGWMLNGPGEFGDNAMLGTDDGGCNLLEEARFGQLLARSDNSPATAGDLIRLLVGSHAHASTTLGYELGGIHQDATADLMILNYPANQPIDSENLAAHIICGLAPRHIETVIIGGAPILRGRRFPDVDMRRLRPLLRRGANEIHEIASQTEEV